MEINSWFYLLVYSSFTIGVLIVGLPLGINYTVTGVKSLIKYGFQRFPKDSTPTKYGKNAVEVIIAGLVMLGLSVWYLFFDYEGNLMNLYIETKKLIR